MSSSTPTGTDTVTGANTSAANASDIASRVRREHPPEQRQRRHPRAHVPSLPRSLTVDGRPRTRSGWILSASPSRAATRTPGSNRHRAARQVLRRAERSRLCPVARERALRGERSVSGHAHRMYRGPRGHHAVVTASTGNAHPMGGADRILRRALRDPFAARRAMSHVGSSGRGCGELRSTLHRARCAGLPDWTSMLRLALLDDHPAVLAGLRRLIEPQADMIVIAAAPTVGELSQQLGGDRADVLVLDYDLARGDGLIHCLRVKRGALPPAVIIYSAYSGHGLVLAARAAGADGMVDKGEPVQHLLAAIRGLSPVNLRCPPCRVTLTRRRLPPSTRRTCRSWPCCWTAHPSTPWRRRWERVGRRSRGGRSGGSRKRPRTLAGGVSDGAAFVLPAGHLLGVTAAHAGSKRPVRRWHPALVASTHGDPNLLDE